MAKGARDARTYAIIGAAMGVHGVLGSGFLEAVYRRALAVELAMRDIPFRIEVAFDVTYKGAAVGQFRADFVCHDDIIVEVKALARLSSADDAQLINYLKAGARGMGLLLNFGAARLEYRRLVHGGMRAALPSSACGDA